VKQRTPGGHSDRLVEAQLKSAPRVVSHPFSRCRLGTQSYYRINEALDVALRHAQAALGLADYGSDLTVLVSDEDRRPADCNDAVKLAGDDKAFQFRAQTDEVEIGRSKALT